jgi:hypothetical protein
MSQQDPHDVDALASSCDLEQNVCRRRGVAGEPDGETGDRRRLEVADLAKDPGSA